MENETKDIPLSEAAMSRVEKTQESVQKMQEQIQKAQQEMSAYLQGILDATGAPEGVNYQVDMEKRALVEAPPEEQAEVLGQQG